MKAAVFHGIESITIDNVQVPSLGENDVLVKVKACGVCGTDFHIFSGAKGAADCVAPTTLGHEFAGVVKQAGSGVHDFRPGDRVAIDPNNVCGACPSCLSGKAHFCLRMVGTGTTSDGGFAEYCLVHRRQLNRIGDELSFEEGAMAEPVSCCLHGLDLTEVRPGDDVLIIGGGTIGQIMVRLCALSGAARIALLEPVEQKRALALRSGACMAENPFDEGYETKLLSAFPGKFNKVIECVGSKATMENAVRFAGNASVVLLFGLTAPDCAMEIRPYDLFRNEITLKASYINPYTIARAVALLNSGRLQVRDLISDVIALEDCVKVFTDASYRTRGKIIIRP